MDVNSWRKFVRAKNIDNSDVQVSATYKSSFGPSAKCCTCDRVFDRHISGLISHAKTHLHHEASMPVQTLTPGSDDGSFNIGNTIFEMYQPSVCPVNPNLAADDISPIPEQECMHTTSLEVHSDASSDIKDSSLVGSICSRHYGQHKLSVSILNGPVDGFFVRHVKSSQKLQYLTPIGTKCNNSKLKSSGKHVSMQLFAQNIEKTCVDSETANFDDISDVSAIHTEPYYADFRASDDVKVDQNSLYGPSLGFRIDLCEEQVFRQVLADILTKECGLSRDLNGGKIPLRIGRYEGVDPEIDLDWITIGSNDGIQKNGRYGLSPTSFNRSGFDSGDGLSYGNDISSASGSFYSCLEVVDSDFKMNIETSDSEDERGSNDEDASNEGDQTEGNEDDNSGKNNVEDVMSEGDGEEDEEHNSGGEDGDDEGDMKGVRVP